MGGHTLRKHVGRTDEQLRERLDEERGISAASSYTDRAAAEIAVGTVLEQAHGRIERWLERGGRAPNLVLDYHGNRPIGRTLHRGDSTSQPCSDAKVVLRMSRAGQYYVLTSYPECR
jgi:anti-sigma factor ChrR (cupin superfamily)